SILVVRVIDPLSGSSVTSRLAPIRQELARYRGRELRFDGDTVLASFDGPTRAVRCAAAVRAALQAVGADAACGVHTGEIELTGDSATGGAIDAAIDIARCTEPGEILVSRTVTDLVAGSQLHFAEHDFKAQAGLSSCL